MTSSLKWPVLILAVLLLFLPIACKKKPQPLARTPVPPARTTESTPAARPAPEIELSASPTTLRRGDRSTLNWTSSNADSVVIDSGVGNVAPSGTITVSPLESTTYTAVAKGAGGESRTSARITVVRDERKTEITETDVTALQKAIDDGVIKPVFFAYDSADLSPQARATLEQDSRVFRQYPDATIIIEGHCDERGTEEYNLALGDRRAQAAKDYLVQLGVSASRMQTISYGEEKPFATGSNEAAWAQNRRAHFRVR
ncbi:MAG: peptidoglycan-associated lipoprotein Pal [Acidobacteriota bacterium]